MTDTAVLIADIVTTNTHFPVPLPPVLTDAELREQISIEEIDQVISDAHHAFRSHLGQAGLAALQLGRALIQVRDESLFTHFGYASYEAYCDERHGISRKFAHQLTKPIYRLGLERYRELITTYSVRKTFALSLISGFDPDLFTHLTTPDAHGVTPAAQLTATDLDAQAQHLRERDATILQLQDNLTREMGKHDQIVKKLREGQDILQRSADMFYREREQLQSEMTSAVQIARKEEQQRQQQQLADLQAQLARLHAQPPRVPSAPLARTLVAAPARAELVVDGIVLPPHGSPSPAAMYAAAVDMLERAAPTHAALAPDEALLLVRMLRLVITPVLAWKHDSRLNAQGLMALGEAERDLREALVRLL